MIGIVAVFKIKPENVEDFKKLMKETGAKVKANEPGCKLYEFMQDKKDPTSLAFMELYADQAAADLHGKTEYLGAAFKTASAWFAEKPSIKFYNPA